MNGTVAEPAAWLMLPPPCPSGFPHGDQRLCEALAAPFAFHALLQPGEPACCGACLVKPLEGPGRGVKAFPALAEGYRSCPKLRSLPEAPAKGFWP